MIRGRRLRAPRDDRGVLIAPPWPELISLVEANVAASSTRGAYDFDGKPLAQLTDAAREQLVRAAHEYTTSYRDASPLAPHPSPLILGGHQPELFHPGVWAKNFALASSAEAVGGTAVNLVIDGDVLKSPTIRVPTGSVETPRVETVPFDEATTEMPYEERYILDRPQFTTFGRRAAEIVRPLIADPLSATYWLLVLEEVRDERVPLGAAIARARHRLEGAWGLNTLELPQSRLCELPAFHEFASHLLADLPRFHEAHNGALADYRRTEKIRGAGRPVPPLVRDDDWLEAPFWIWTREAPQRRRVFARSVGGHVELTDRGALRLRLPRSALGELSGRGIRLRSRALLTTLFARAVIDSTFLHGIGGGKYDELTDEIVRRYLGFEPPGFGVVTATRHLPIARPPRVGADERSLRQRQWELTYHPETFLDAAAQESHESTAAAPLVAEKQRLVAEAAERSTSKSWCQAIRAVNERLQPYVAETRRQTAVAAEAARQFSQAETILTNREYSFCLFPEKDLRDFFASNFTLKR